MFTANLHSILNDNHFLAEQHYHAPDFQTNLDVFCMHVRRVNNTWSFPAHEHTQFELNYTLEGEQVFRINGKHYHMQAGDLLLIPPANIHYCEQALGNECMYFCLHFEINDSQFLNVLHQAPTLSYRANSAIVQRVFPYLQRLIDYTKQANNATLGHRMKLHAAIFEMFAHFSQSLTRLHEVPKTNHSSRKVLAQNIAKKIEAIVHTQTTYSPTDSHNRTNIEDIAEEMGISVSYCHRIFREHYHMSPRQYLSKLVLERAKQLLHKNHLSADKISRLLGYSEYGNFSRQFKRWTGYSPKAYRDSILS